MDDKNITNEELKENIVEKHTADTLEMEAKEPADVPDEVKEDKKEEDLLVLPMIPLRGMSILPSMVLHFDIGRQKSVRALEKAMAMNQQIFLVSQMDENVEIPTHADFYHIGTIGKVKQMLKMPGDTIRVLVEGVCRGEIAEIISDAAYFKCRVRAIPEKKMIPTIAMEALMRTVLDHFDEYLARSERKNGSEIFTSVMNIKDPARFADTIGIHLDVNVAMKQRIIEAFDVEERLNILNGILIKEIEILTIQHDINDKVKATMDKNQKDYYLREQLNTIQKELDGDEAEEDEVQKWKQALIDKQVPEKIAAKVNKEISRLRKLQPGSAEVGVVRQYIETIVELPWNNSNKTKINMKKAEAILEEDHYGLEKVKERVLEYLAVVQLSESLKGPILCLVGPPGVGKTSVARSVARATGREFARMSLGGVRDEAEIRGHRRTYIGAIPGRVISAIKDCESNNPVFLFDEVDKIGADFKGDPASALLEVLDPEQNKDFMDHYLEVPFDLSNVMFITTANTTDTIPRPLLDRMEVIHVPGYTEEEKVEIAKRYLVPKAVKANGLKPKNIEITEAAIRDIINYYTRESGVRNLEREISNICRKTARKIVTDGPKHYKINPKQVEMNLGKKVYRYDIVEGEPEVGVVTGLAWTIVGGDTLQIETAVLPGSGQLVLTGQLGDVMQESAKAGYSYVRSIADKLGIREDFYKTLDLHIHIPEGAVPKDGPSAGVTMCTAMVSALTGRAVRKDIAMTGEISLRGKVLPVGGIREKVLAAYRAGVKEILLPADNKRDIDDIPANVRKKLKFVLLDTVDDALKETLL